MNGLINTDEDYVTMVRAAGDTLTKKSSMAKKKPCTDWVESMVRGYAMSTSCYDGD